MLTAILSVILKILKFVLDIVVKIVARILRITGLHVPLLYGIYILVLYAIYGFDLSAPSVETTLFYIGLATSFVCCAVIFAKNISKPFAFLSRKTVKVHYENDNRNERRNIPKRQIYHERAVEKPDIYWSRLYPDILVHEYHDRFKLYKRINGEMRLVKIEYKDEIE